MLRGRRACMVVAQPMRPAAARNLGHAIVGWAKERSDVPTIKHSARNGGHASLCPPYVSITKLTSEVIAGMSRICSLHAQQILNGTPRHAPDRDLCQWPYVSGFL